MKTVRDFIFLDSKITAEDVCSSEMKRCLLLGGKAMTNLDRMLKSRGIILPTKIYLVEAMVFLVVMYVCKSRTIKKAKHQRIYAFEPWCWRRLLRVPWTAWRSIQSILKEISPEYSLEGLMLKLKLQYFGHLMQRTDPLEKTPMLGKVEGRRRGQKRMRWLDGITNSQSLFKFMFTESVMQCNHLILCHPLLLLPSIFPSIRVFSNESQCQGLFKWVSSSHQVAKYWSFCFSISPSNEYSGFVFFRIDWFDLLAIQGTLNSLLQHHNSKALILRRSAFF